MDGIQCDKVVLVGHSKRKKISELPVLLDRIEVTQMPPLMYEQLEDFASVTVGVTAYYTKGGLPYEERELGCDTPPDKDGRATGFECEIQRIDQNNATILITYEDENGLTAETSFDILIYPIILSSIAVTRQPTKTTYVSGESFNSLGMVVEATYTQNGVPVRVSEVTGYTVSPSTLTDGVTQVTIGYYEATATVDVTVTKKFLNL